jgi:ribosomal protein S18 acetylase RimI-like enzyme
MGMATSMSMTISPYEQEVHDLGQVATLLYETDPAVSRILFGKSKADAEEKISRLILTGGNDYGKETLYVYALHGVARGVLVAFDAKTRAAMDDSAAFMRVSGGGTSCGCTLGRALEGMLTKEIPSDCLYISNVCVDPVVSGQGIGPALIEYAAGLAYEHGCSRLLLDVSGSNTRAARLYERLGFTRYTTRRSLLLLGAQVHGMEKRLVPSGL